MEISELNKKISEKDFSKIYFFFGDENYLKDFYIQRIIKSVISDGMEAFNLFTFNDATDISGIIDAIQQPPLMSEYKVVYLNEVDISKANSDFRDKMLEIIKDIPDFCILIIRETQTDGKLKLVKALEKDACSVKCVYPDEKSVVSFIIREFKKRNKIISPQLAQKFAVECENKLYSVINVIDAVSGYLKDSEEVSEEALKMFMVQSFETVIFNLSEFIVTKQFNRAYDVLNKLRLKPSQNPAPKLFSMISDHILGIYLVYLCDNAKLPQNEISELLGNKRDFVIRKYRNQLKNIDAKRLPEIIKFCAENDYKLKNGLVSDMYLPIYELIAMFL